MGIGSVTTSSPFSRSQSMWLQSDSQTGEAFAKEIICKQNYFNSNFVQGGTEQNVRWCQWWLPLSPSLATDCRQPKGAMLKVVNRLYQYFVLYSSILCYVCHNKIIKPWLKTHAVCLPPTSGSCIHPPSDGNVYKYMPHSFKCIYNPISYVSSFPQPSPSCHNLWRSYPCMHASLHAVLCVLI